MALEERMKAEPCAGSLSACLVDGNVEQNARERKIKRRALAISISLQSIGLTALGIAPMLARPAELAMRTTPPMPIYSSRPVRQVVNGDPAHRPTPGPCFVCALNTRPQTGRIETGTTNSQPGEDTIDIGKPVGPDNTGLNVYYPRQPAKPETPPSQPRVVHMTRVDPALLTNRVEPVYPPIAKQIRRSGKVELHALIATDGSVQSLEVVSGEAIFIQSALAAVRQWRYRPTYLNGQAVEVDTYITVIYTLQQ